MLRGILYDTEVLEGRVGWAPRYFRRRFCSYVIGISSIVKLYLLEI